MHHTKDCMRRFYKRLLFVLFISVVLCCVFFVFCSAFLSLFIFVVFSVFISNSFQKKTCVEHMFHNMSGHSIEHIHSIIQPSLKSTKINLISCLLFSSSSSSLSFIFSFLFKFCSDEVIEEVIEDAVDLEK